MKDLFGNLIEMNASMWKKMETVRLLRGQPGTQYQEANDANKAIIRDWVRSLLQQQAITVTFVKADGTVRDMLCTLNADFIPTVSLPKGNAVSMAQAAVKTSISSSTIDDLLESVPNTKPRKEPDPHSIRVFDLDKLEWRSFRFDRLQKITAELSFK